MSYAYLKSGKAGLQGPAFFCLKGLCLKHQQATMAVQEGLLTCRRACA